MLILEVWGKGEEPSKETKVMWLEESDEDPR